MALRTMRSLSLGFGMVSIPVKLYKLTDDGGSGVALCNIHRDCGTAVKEPKYCPKCSKILETGDLMKAYPEDKKKEHCIPITEEELATLPLVSKDTIQIDGTIKAVPGIGYPDALYGLEPEEKGFRAFALLEIVMREAGVMGVSKIALGNKEHLLVVRPTGDGLLYLQTLHFTSDIRDFSELKRPTVSVSEKEIQMGRLLLGMLPQDVDLATYKNEYGEALRALVERKKALKPGEALSALPVAAPKEIDLVEQLMASLKMAETAKVG